MSTDAAAPAATATESSEARAAPAEPAAAAVASTTSAAAAPASAATTTAATTATTTATAAAAPAVNPDSPVRVVVVVGASSGIGAEIARQYSQVKEKQRVYKVVLAARRVDRLEVVAKACREANAAAAVPEVGGERFAALCVACDATKQSDCEALVARVIGEYGRLDVLVYNVGQAMHVKFAAITQLDAVMSAMMDTNFTGAVYCTYHALPHLKRSRGQIVAVSSVAGDISPPYLCFYTAAKHALQGFFESVRLEVEDDGVVVTIVQPGYVATEIDDKKVVGDGTVQSVELATDRSKYMPVEKAGRLILEAALKRKNKKVPLTSAGALGATLHAFMPGTVDAAAKKEMEKISRKRE